MRFEIPYAKKKINIEIPDKNIIPIIFKEHLLSDTDGEDNIIKNALDNPMSLDRLSSLAYKKNHVCILVSDITRPCPSYKFLPFLIEELKKTKVREIEIIFGLGIHRKHTDEEKIKLAGDMAAKNCKLTDSDISRCKFIGNTSYNTPVEIFNDVLKSDFLIATGNIEYHYFAGYSGGSKALMPGVCSKNSISANHSMMLEDNACAGKFFDNLVRCDIEEAGKIAGIDFIFNVILDDNKKIIGAAAGKNNEAYLEGISIFIF
ncbi:MAG: lactate racemase domain-containing protein, partial [Actinobacteria bacterium]|nr:lactate racemase domain-containing protein [Actinomycetota bacterium]